MIKRAYYHIARGTEPYHNQALEQYLLESVEPETIVLYLWQNRRTVVIGRNQNCWQECRVEQLQRDGGFLARRRSGGGAVYHDGGNLNFTFIVNAPDYDVRRQQQVLLQAVRQLGIGAEITGRNDLLAAGRKFSGNAYYTEGGKKYHHGTLLADTDEAALSRYLSVPQDKLHSKGVASVKARVINLRELCPDLTIESLQQLLLLSLEQVYGCRPQPLAIPDFKTTAELPASCDTAAALRISALESQFASADWLYGRKLPFTWRAQRRFAWGSLELQLQIDRGQVTAAAVYSDALEAALLAALPKALQGCVFSYRDLSRCLTELAASPVADCSETWARGRSKQNKGEQQLQDENLAAQSSIITDVQQWLYEQLL